MHPYLSSQLTAERQASLIAEASRRRLASQARAARKAAIPADPARQPVRQPVRMPRLRVWLRHRVPA